MARLFVFNDNLTARVEIVDTTGAGDFAAECAGCRADILSERAAAGYSEPDAIEEACAHVDRCRRCADPDCRTMARHDAGHRCRKVA